jgi:hypothetical protein
MVLHDDNQGKRNPSRKKRINQGTLYIKVLMFIPAPTEAKAR